MLMLMLSGKRGRGGGPKGAMEEWQVAVDKGRREGRHTETFRTTAYDIIDSVKGRTVRVVRSESEWALAARFKKSASALFHPAKQASSKPGPVEERRGRGGDGDGDGGGDGTGERERTRDIRGSVHTGVLLTLASPAPRVADRAVKDMLVGPTLLEGAAGDRLGGWLLHLACIDLEDHTVRSSGGSSPHKQEQPP